MHHTKHREGKNSAMYFFSFPLLRLQSSFSFMSPRMGNKEDRNARSKGRKKKRVSSKAGLKDSPVTLKPIVTSLGNGRKATKKKELYNLKTYIKKTGFSRKKKISLAFWMSEKRKKKRRWRESPSPWVFKHIQIHTITKSNVGSLFFSLVLKKEEQQGSSTVIQKRKATKQSGKKKHKTKRKAEKKREN